MLCCVRNLYVKGNDDTLPRYISDCHACLIFTDDITLYLLKATRLKEGLSARKYDLKTAEIFNFQVLAVNV